MKQYPFHPPVYYCRRADMPLTLDGRLDKPFWADIPFTDPFVDIEGPESAFDKANAFLAEADEAFRKGHLTGKFSFMSDYECAHLPFTSIDTRLYVPEMDMDETSAALGLIAGLNKECPQLSIDGIVEMVRSHAGMRNTYHVISDAGDDSITAEQEIEGL